MATNDNTTNNVNDVDVENNDNLSDTKIDDDQTRKLQLFAQEAGLPERSIQLVQHYRMTPQNTSEFVQSLSTIQDKDIYETYFAHPGPHIRRYLRDFGENITSRLYRGTQNDYSNLRINQRVNLGGKSYSLNCKIADSFTRFGGTVIVLVGNKLAVRIAQSAYQFEEEYRLLKPYGFVTNIVQGLGYWIVEVQCDGEYDDASVSNTLVAARITDLD